ncbi:MAG: right-handed parallel beta-helix repeat-containing protein [Candidatus Thermoplasmatota archaeon]|nr:right-handed parallel beta-helix repeat-containing protein [Candidatus Thermoplasmatota archaeon]
MKTYKIIIILSIFSLLIIAAVPNALSDENVKIIYVDDNGTKDYVNIQEALDIANDSYTIYVYNGTYDGYFSINKSIKLIGENKENTIITGSQTTNKKYLIQITADNVTISNFTITNSTIPPEILINGSINPKILYEYGIGISIESNNNQIINNKILCNQGYAIKLNNSQNTNISKNRIMLQQTLGIFLKNSNNNVINNNTIKENERGIQIQNTSNNNKIILNNFIDNSYYNVYDNGTNIWYDNTSQVGNYYDNYTGMDKNNDARGDTPYNILGGKNQDLYPLMAPYIGRLIPDKYYVDNDLVIYMLWIAMIVTIIFVMPIAYIWYRKTKPRK